MTPSDWAAPLRRLSGSSRLPRCTSAPAALRYAAPASDRVSPSTWWPALINSGTMAEPMKPVAPVRNTRMLCSPSEPDKTESFSACGYYRRQSPVASSWRDMSARRKQASVRKPRSDEQRNRERILEAAKEAFTRAGVDASLDEIAKEAGVGAGTLYRHFPTRETLLGAVYRTEMEKLASAERKFAEELPPVEALRAWLLLFVDYIAAKQLIGPALNALLGDPKKVFEDSHARVWEAIRALVKRAIKSGDMRQDLDPVDLLRALIGVANVATSPDWQQSARRLVDILITGSRPAK